MDRALVEGAINESSGSYIGTGMGMSFNLGRRPRVVKIHSADMDTSVQCFDTNGITIGQIALGVSKNLRTLEVPAGDGIIIDDEGFSVGASTAVNEVGTTYLWEVI